MGLGLGLAAGAIAGGLLGDKDSTQRTVSSPWGPQQKYLKRGFQRAEDLYNSGAPTIAPFNPTQNQAFDMARSAATGMVPQLTGATNEAFMSALRAPDVENNPFLPQVVQGAIRPVTQTLTEQWLPQITSSAVGAGQLGGSRQGIAEGIALRGAADMASDRTAQIMSQAYGQGLNAQAAAMRMLPTMISGAVAPSEIIGRVGGMEQGMEQAMLSEPERRLRAYIDMISGNFGGESLSTIPGDPLAGALGGASLVAGLGGLGAGGPLFEPASSWSFVPTR